MKIGLKALFFVFAQTFENFDSVPHDLKDGEESRDLTENRRSMRFRLSASSLALFVFGQTGGQLRTFIYTFHECFHILKSKRWRDKQAADSWSLKMDTALRYFRGEETNSSIDSYSYKEDFDEKLLWS
jgi:hypothetical protein